MSDFIPPQLLGTAPSMPRGDDWRYERKYDGWRAQVHVTNQGVRIFTRSGLDWTDRFARLADEVARSVNVPCILDGEICALDQEGRPNFTKLSGQIPQIAVLDFFAFDLLAVDSHALTHLPLFERRRRLIAVLPPTAPTLHVVDQFAEPDEVLTFVRAKGWEGIVAKRVDSTYHPAERTSDWLKFKCKKRQEFVVIGWRPDPLAGTLKSLVLGTFDGGQLTLRGSVGTGFSQLQRRELPQQLKSMGRRASRSTGPAYNTVQPELVAEIEYLELSDGGILRQPTFLGLRHDKSPQTVGLESESFSPAISKTRS